VWGVRMKIRKKREISHIVQAGKQVEREKLNIHIHIYEKYFTFFTILLSTEKSPSPTTTATNDEQQREMEKSLRNVFPCPISLVILSSFDASLSAVPEHVNFPSDHFLHMRMLNRFIFHSHHVLQLAIPEATLSPFSVYSEILVQIFIVRRCFAYTLTKKFLLFSLSHVYVRAYYLLQCPSNLSRIMKNIEFSKKHSTNPSLSLRRKRKK
jgi:hypothetical protein